MHPPATRTQQVTLHDYFLQAKSIQAKASRKSPSAASYHDDCFTKKSQTTSASSQASHLKKKHLESPKLPPGTLVNLESKDLLPGFQQRPTFNPENIQMDDLVLCHMTGYLSPTGKIPSNLESGYSVRATTHFSLNHPVGEVEGQGTIWKSKKYCILLPLKEGLKLNGKPAGCLEVDTYWNKSFDYNSSQSILIVQKEDVPVGQAEVLKPSSQGLPEDSKVLVLATYELPHDAAKKILPKMGRTLLEAGHVTWGDSEKVLPQTMRFYKDSKNTLGKQRAGFKRFLRAHHLKEMMDCMSPYWQYQGVLLRIQSLELLNRDMWQFNSTNYQEVLLKKIQQVKQELTPQEQRMLKCNEIERLIKESQKPSDTIEPLKSVLGIEHIMEPCYFESVQGMATMIHQFPDQKERLFLLHDARFSQNLSEDFESINQTARTNLLAPVPAYFEISSPKSPDLKAMYLERIFQQETQALLALLEDTSKSQKSASQFPDRKAQLEKIRKEFRQKREEIIKFKEVIPGEINPQLDREHPVLYKNVLINNLKKMEPAEDDMSSVSSTSSKDS